MDVLFIKAYWHSFAKLRMHTDSTLDILTDLTTQLGCCLRDFVHKTCVAYETRKLQWEADAQVRKNGKNPQSSMASSSKRPMPQQKVPEASTVETAKESLLKPQSSGIGQKTQRLKTFNLDTFKHHAIGDVVSSIQMFGTTDSYSTEPVSHLASPLTFLDVYVIGRIGTLNSKDSLPTHKLKMLCQTVDTN
jgi:hypothetical protein